MPAAGERPAGRLLLAIDVGNTQTVIGLYDGPDLVDHWRTTSTRSRTADELAAGLRALLGLRGRDLRDVAATVVSSTVPQLGLELAAMARIHLGHDALVVGPGVRSGLPLEVDSPHEVGPDRVVNCVAAVERHGAPCIVVDFGTAITFDAVSPAGAFVGGAIAPGLEIAMEALGARAARLLKVELRAPAQAIGRTTVANMQSGAVFGCAGMVDALVTRFRDELGAPSAPAVATGGMAGVVAPYCSTVTDVEPWLTLEGLRLVWERNRPRA
jgi:type III pantothenate kinase